MSLRPSPVRTRAVRILALGIVVASAACGSSTPDGDRIQATPFPDTVLLTPADLAAVTSVAADGTVTFAAEAPSAAALAKATILVGGVGPRTPRGLLRRVLKVETVGEQVVVTTGPATLLQAFKRLDLKVHRDAPAPAPAARASALADPATPAPVGVIRAPLTVDIGSSQAWTLDVEWPVFDGDGDEKTKEDRVVVSGTLTGTVGFDLEISFDWGDLADLASKAVSLVTGDVLDAIGFKARFLANLGATADARVSGRSSLAFETTVQLGPPVYLPAIPIGPVVLTPRIQAMAGVKGGATGIVDVHLAETAGLEVGIEASGHGVSPIGAGPSFTPGEASATLNASAFARAYVEPRIDLLVYDVAGPYASLIPYVEVRADSDKDPCWRLHGGIDGRLGITLEVLGVKLLDEKVDKSLVDKEFASGHCDLPPGPTGGPLDPQFAPWARTWGGAVDGPRTDETAGALARAHDGRWLITSPASSALLKVDPDGRPVWARAYRRDTGGFDEHYVPSRAVPVLDTGILVLGEDGVVIKTDAAGRLAWAGTLDLAASGGSGTGAAVATADGGVLAAGNVLTESGRRDGWIASFDPAGNVRWARRIQGAWSQHPAALAVLPDGGFLAAGWGEDAGHDNGWLLKAAPDGTPAWFHRLKDCDPDKDVGEKAVTIRTVLVTAEGDYVIGGRTWYPNYKALIAKVKPDGSIPWTRLHGYAGGGGLDLAALVQLEGGSFAAAGMQPSLGTQDANWVGEFDVAGRTTWAKRVHGPGNDGQPALAFTPDDRGLVVWAPTSSWWDYPGGAWAFKVPRKDGTIAFAASAGVTVADLGPSDVDGCLVGEAYPATVDAVAARVVPLPGARTEDVPVQSVDLAP